MKSRPKIGKTFHNVPFRESLTLRVAAGLLVFADDVIE